MSHPVTPGPCAPHVRPAAPQPHGAVFQISHMPYGIRNSESQNRESGNSESWCGRVGHLHPPWSHEVHEVLILWVL